MTEKEYNQAAGVRRSDLWRIHDSPEKFKWFLDHPEPQSPAFAFGSMVHKLLLEPETFDEEYAVAPEVDKRTKAGKEAWAAFCASAGEKAVVSIDDYGKALCTECGKKIKEQAKPQEENEPDTSVADALMAEMEKE